MTSQDKRWGGRRSLPTSDGARRPRGAFPFDRGHSVFGPHRACGYATAALGLMVERLTDEGTVEVAAMSIHEHNAASLRVAEKAGFVRIRSDRDEVVFARRLR